ncbi:uncharacterized protein LOC123428171 [Hordeum vulgare subsp. vulgare]|uniref:Uncharacterized protein n=1 Tax=Hordeum vulgare subsp. vulgare TaxID=112509 RepID=A0A8I6WU63_HORVV|nr:uncharacterized protein LOC123428171 [Hordeum vulgare subsp. vulgare]
MSGCPCSASTSTSSSPLSLLPPPSSVPATPRCIRVAFSSSCDGGARAIAAASTRRRRRGRRREIRRSTLLVRDAAPCSCRGVARSGRQCRPDALHDRGDERTTGMVREGNRDFLQVLMV